MLGRDSSYFIHKPYLHSFDDISFQIYAKSKNIFLISDRLESIFYSTTKIEVNILQVNSPWMKMCGVK